MPTVGAMTFMFIGVILFAMVLFVTCFKRQVGRIKERSRRDPHVPGSEAKKVSVERGHCFYYYLLSNALSLYEYIHSSYLAFDSKIYHVGL